MSSLIVEVVEVEEVKKHPNADLLELVRVKNWWVVEKIGKWHVGQKGVYLPPESVISQDQANTWGIAKYTGTFSRMEQGSLTRVHLILAARIRGERSYGFLAPLDDQALDAGTSMAEAWNITKYDPPPKVVAGDAEEPIWMFQTYTDIENIGNFPGVFRDGEEVVFTEKLHGTNSRVGVLKIAEKTTGELNWTLVAGSRRIRLKPVDKNGNSSIYWSPMYDQMKNLLFGLNGNSYNVIVYGEIVGPGIQDMSYGLDDIRFRAFDIRMDGFFLDFDLKVKIFNKHDIDTVPVVYRGPFSMKAVAEYTNGQTKLCTREENTSKFKGREGIVITPVKERNCQLLPNFGRVILKSISADYLARKNATP